MNKAEWTAFRAAVKTLDAGPKKIAAARAEYAEADKYMQEHKRIYSQIAQENYYKTAQAKRDTAIKGEVAKIAKALETVREYRTFPGEAIDLSSTKLMNALTVINTMGKKLRPDEQLSIAQQFVGEPAALHFLGELYRKNGLFYADHLDAMAKPISETAIENLEYCVGAYEGLGKWPFEDRCYWTANEFAQAATRYGFDVADGKDVYVEALKDARAGQTPEAQRILSGAIAQIQNGREYLTDAQKAEIFNDASAKVKALADDAEAAEISRQATTQEALDTIRATAGTAENAYEGSAE